MRPRGYIPPARQRERVRVVGKPWWPDAVVLYAEGKNPQQVARELGLHRGSVVHALQSMGLLNRVPK